MQIHQGIDLVKIERIKKIYSMYSENFLKKVFSEKELIQIKENTNKIYKIASKFSAKEATVKALGTGFSNGIYFKNIEILNLKSGKPTIHLNGKAKYVLKNIISSTVSISDESEFVISVVTFLTE
jgi:holo-[acyl-carrier protein] synthase